jgi:flagellar biogenesis protein FliO
MLALPWAAPCPGAPTEDASRATAPAPAATAPAEASSDDQAGRVVPRKTGGDESRPIGGGGSGGDVVGWLRTLGALAVVAGLIFAARRLLRRWAGSAPAGQAGPMEVLARASVAPRQQLLLIRLGKRLVLIGSGGGTMTTLAEVSDEAEVDDLMQSVKAAKGAGLAGLLTRRKEGFNAENAEIAKDAEKQ